MKYTKLNPSKSTGLKISKKKRKFRVMTLDEYCTYRKTGCKGCEYRQSLTSYCDYYCDYSNFNKVNRERDKNKPYKTKDGKYILIEVKNNGRNYNKAT